LKAEINPIFIFVTMQWQNSKSEAVARLNSDSGLSTLLSFLAAAWRLPLADKLTVYTHRSPRHGHLKAAAYFR
jgi:hypothetical protein